MTNNQQSPMARTSPDGARSSILVVLRRHWTVVAVCVLVVTAVSLVYALTQPKTYTASASLLFRDPQLDQKLFGSSFVSANTDAGREAATNLRLASLEVVAGRVAARMRPGTTATDVQDVTAVAAAGQSDVASITAEDHDPGRAARIANLLAEEFVAFRKQADQSKVRETQALVRRELDRMSPTERASSRGRSLQARAQQLQILASLQTGNVEIAERASVPTEASSPRPVRSGLTGIVIGLLIGLVAAYGREKLDRRLRDQDELAAIFGRPLLASVRKSRSLSEPGASDARRPETEPFRMLRASLRYFEMDKELRCLVIASAQAGDGKSLIAWHLAVASAQAGKRTLIIEADMRRPGIARRLPDVLPGPGLTDVLTRSANLDDAVHTVPVLDEARPGETRSLDVLLAGPLPPDPVDLIDSEAMRGLLAEARAGYDLVIVDTPPSTIVADAIPLFAEADGVIVVGWVKKTLRRAVFTLQNQLATLDAPVLGVVANAVSASGGQYYDAAKYYDADRVANDAQLPVAP
ncbi:MAG: polysaccharide biosynthesis tyrosine autokinase [Patulibacter sp.]